MLIFRFRLVTHYVLTKFILTLTMQIATRDFRAKRLSDKQIRVLPLQDCIFGTDQSNKYLLAILSLLAIVFLGCISGFFSGKLFTDILFDYQGLRYLSIGFLIIIFISTSRLGRLGILSVLVQSVVYGFLWIPLVAVLLLVVGALWDLSGVVIFGIVMNTLNVGFAIFNTVVLAILFQVAEQSLPSRHWLLKRIFVLWMGIVTIAVATLLSSLGVFDSQTLSDFRQISDPPPGSLEFVVIGSLVWTGFISLKGFELSFCMTNSESKFLWLRQWCTRLAAWRGTSFHDLDLSHLNFTNTTIANCDFRANSLFRTCLLGVNGLDRAWVDNRYLDLDQPKVQHLLTSGIAQDTRFQHLNLQGAFLQGADLREVDFTDSSLHSASLRHANLRDVLFIRARITSADLSGADLTGCCIKDWSTNRHTDFSGVICNYIYRDYEADRPTNRYPKDRDFQVGEFEQLQKEADNSVELVFQGSANLWALDLTLEQFKLEENNLGLELEGIEKRGDSYIVKVSYQEGISPNHLKQKVYNTYNVFLQAGTSSPYSVVQQIGDVMETQNISGGGNIDQSSGKTNIQIDGNISGSTLNLGTISGDVSNLIYQVRESSLEDAHTLAEILTNLQAQIQSEPQLSDQQKQDALEAVATIAEEAKKEPENRAAKLCSMAINALKGITSGLSEASKLAETMTKTVPLLKGVLGIL